MPFGININAMSWAEIGINEQCGLTQYVERGERRSFIVPKLVAADSGKRFPDCPMG